MRYLVVLVALTGCELVEHPQCGLTRTCTDELRFLGVHVTDAAGNPIVDATHTTTVDGHVIDVEQSLTLGVPGDYIVLEDGQAHDGSTATFEVDAPQGSAIGRYRISTDVCNCDHLGTIDGPRILVVQ
jgi:hypothetical protein